MEKKTYSDYLQYASTRLKETGKDLGAKADRFLFYLARLITASDYLDGWKELSRHGGGLFIRTAFNDNAIPFISENSRKFVIEENIKECEKRQAEMLDRLRELLK